VSAPAEFTAPEGVTEELLAEIWSVLLKHEPVDRHDNFFEVGGHSLLAMQLVSRIRETFSIELPVRELFEHPMLSSLARAVEHARSMGTLADDAIEAVSRNEPLPLSYAQQRMLFLHEYTK
jgi:acyl carrier protein